MKTFTLGQEIVPHLGRPEVKGTRRYYLGRHTNFGGDIWYLRRIDIDIDMDVREPWLQIGTAADFVPGTDRLPPLIVLYYYRRTR